MVRTSVLRLAVPLVAVCLAFASAALTIPVRAQESALRIATLEHGAWPESVAALEADTRAQGATLHVVVFDDGGHLAPCGRYVLTFDDAGMRAFSVGGCDAPTSATELTLASRAALFAHDGPVPRPLAIRMTATEVRVGDAAGGAAMTGGAALDCSVGVRPYLDDLEHGGVVYLGPDRYEVRPRDTSVRVDAAASNWSLHARASASVTIQYDVIERATGAVVLTDQATLTCGDLARPPGAQTAVATSAPTSGSRADHVVVLQGTDMPQMAEVVGVVDVHEPVGDEATALRLVREQAARMGADAVIGVQFHHGEGGPTHLSGLAVRFVTLRTAS